MENNVKQKKIASIIVILILLLAIGAFAGVAFLQIKKAAPITPTPSPTPSVPLGQKITVKGKVDCLPFKNTGGVQPMMCAIGLQADDGTYWALHDIQNDIVQGKYAGGNKIEVIGTITAYEGPLQVSGTINVTSVRVL